MEVSPELQAKLDQLAKLPRAARLGIIAGIAGLVAAGYFFGIYQDTNAELQQLRAKELELQRKLGEVEVARGRTREARQRVESVWEEYLALTESRPLVEAMIDGAVETLLRLAQLMEGDDPAGLARLRERTVPVLVRAAERYAEAGFPDRAAETIAQSLVVIAVGPDTHPQRRDLETRLAMYRTLGER